MSSAKKILLTKKNQLIINSTYMSITGTNNNENIESKGDELEMANQRKITLV